MPKLGKADKEARISATEAERRRRMAMAQIREMEHDQRHRALHSISRPGGRLAL